MEGIRIETFLGNDKVIVGNKYSDLILESLGKIYIKYGNKSELLNTLLEKLDKTSDQDISNTIIINNKSELDNITYPGDGIFIFDKLSKTLYLSIEGEYIPIVEVTEENTRYVKKTGDSMTGQLEILTSSAPLIVASSELVKNFNSQYLEGYSAKDFTKRNENEIINGNWTFNGIGTANNNWIFEGNIKANKDIISSGSIGTPQFASGFGGYGWRLDGNTNTLTIDNLIVRKALRVYELVVNTINATNGSLWVSNSSTCNSVIPIYIVTLAQLNSIGTWTGSEDNILALKSLIPNNSYILFTDGNLNTHSINRDTLDNGEDIGLVTLTSELSNSNTINTSPKTFINYKYLVYISDIEKVASNPLFSDLSSLYDEELLINETNNTSASDLDFSEFHSNIKLYYITKEKVVTEWDETTPISWEYKESVKKNSSFFVVPNNSDSITKFKRDGIPTEIKLYYKYFGIEKDIIGKVINTSSEGLQTFPNLYIVETKEGEYPTFKPGDIVRCQKFDGSNIKYYDALVCSYINSNTIILQKASSVFDMYTELNYSSDGTLTSYTEKYNNTQYNKTEEYFNTETGQYEKVSDTTVEDRLGEVTKEDDLVQIGNISNTNRQNAIYLTSTDDQSPYIDIISGLNRPDYSIIYNIPVYSKFTKLNEDLTSHTDYYIQETETEDSILLQESPKLLYGTLLPTKYSIIEKEGNEYKYEGTKTTKVRLGKLDGIYNSVFKDKQPYGFGLYGENVFLTGEFYLNNGSSIVDFSEENIMLKFKNAGLTIDEVQKLDEEGNPITDENGNPVYEQSQKVDIDGNPMYDSLGNPIMVDKTQIILTADYIRFNTVNNKKAVEIITSAEDGTARINVEGDIQSHGLKIKNLKGEVTCEITTEGKLIAKEGEFSGTINAEEGTIGNWIIDKALVSANFVNPSTKEVTIINGVGGSSKFLAISSMGKGSMIADDGFVIQRDASNIFPTSKFAGVIAVEGNLYSGVSGLMVDVKQTDTYNAMASVTALDLAASSAYYNGGNVPWSKPVALRIRKGFMDTPGVILAGRVIDRGDSEGAVTEYAYGQYRDLGGGYKECQVSTTGTDASRTRVYSIKHNIGHSKYTVLITPYRPGYDWNKVTPIIDFIGPNNFTVYFVDTGTANNRRLSSFCFAVIGDNYDDNYDYENPENN